MNLVNSLSPLHDEVAILSVVLEKISDHWHLVRASLLIAPELASRTNWSGWHERHHIGMAFSSEPASPQYIVHSGEMLAARVTLTVEEADSWLLKILDTKIAESIGSRPSFHASLNNPKTPIRVSPRGGTSASTFVYSAVRPLTGYLLSLATPPTHRRCPLSTIWHSEDGNDWINTPLILGIPVELTEPCPTGLFVGRMSRTAWLTSFRGSPGLETFDCVIGLEPSRIDISDLSIEFEEWVDGEFVHAQQIHLEDMALLSVERDRSRCTCQL
jgi:hypothetical protein